MADAQLIAVMSARLDKFEAQMKEAGAIADGAVKDIENKFARANPTFRGSFLGTFVGQLTSAGFRQLTSFLEKLPDDLKRIENAANVAGISLADMFSLAAASGNAQEASKLVENLALQLEKIRQGGEKGKLFEIFAANDIQNVKTVEQGIAAIAYLMQKATAAQRILLADTAGIGRELIPFLSQGADAVKRQSDAAKVAGDRLQLISDKAKTFGQQWKDAADTFQTWMLSRIGNVGEAIAKIVEGIAKLVTIIQSPGVAFRRLFGLEEGDANIVNNLNELAKSLRDVGKARKEATGGDGAPAPGGSGINLPQGGTRGGGGGENRFDREEARINRQIALLNAETATIGQNTFARERMRIEAQLMDAATRAGIPKTEDLRNRVAGLATAYATAAQAAETARQRFETIVSASQQFGQALATAFSQAIIEGKNLNDVLRQLIRTLANSALQSAFGSLFGAQGLGGIFGRAFAGGFAGGGSVTPGAVHLVGERGPELFVPRTAGTIMANGAGGVAVTYAPVIDARGADAGAVARLERVIAEDRRLFPSKVVAAVSEARRRSVKV